MSNKKNITTIIVLLAIFPVICNAEDLHIKLNGELTVGYEEIEGMEAEVMGEGEVNTGEEGGEGEVEE